MHFLSFDNQCHNIHYEGVFGYFCFTNYHMYQQLSFKHLTLAFKSVFAISHKKCSLHKSTKTCLQQYNSWQIKQSQEQANHGSHLQTLSAANEFTAIKTAE